jgi:hypothetical protein
MYWVAFGEPLGSINRIFSTEFLSVISMRRIKREAVLARHAHWDRVTYCLSSNVKWRVVGRTSYGVTCLRGALGRDRSVGPAAGEGAMTDFEDHELAQAICRDLLELRARTTPVELSVLAAKAELPANWQPDETKGAIDDARTDAWLAICRLASETANNESRPDKGEYRSPLGRCYRSRSGVGGAISGWHQTCSIGGADEGL